MSIITGFYSNQLLVIWVVGKFTCNIFFWSRSTESFDSLQPTIFFSLHEAVVK
jgi:hypothetical protein